VSDKQIIQECGLLRLLLLGDLVLADRGFNIYELVGMQQTEAKLPSFTKGKTPKKCMSPENWLLLGSMLKG